VTTDKTPKESRNTMRAIWAESYKAVRDDITQKH
jgi:hypothetical protein